MEGSERALRVQQAIAAGADPAEAEAAASGISKITVMDGNLNRTGISEEIDDEVFFLGDEPWTDG